MATQKKTTATEPKPKGVPALSAEEFGEKQPLSAQTESLQATVSGDLGRVLVKITNRGYIGEEPIVLLGYQSNELRELADLLDAAADARLRGEA